MNNITTDGIDNLAIRMRKLSADKEKEVRLKRAQDIAEARRVEEQMFEDKLKDKIEETIKNLPQQIEAEANRGKTSLTILSESWRFFTAEEEYFVSKISDWARKNGFSVVNSRYPRGGDEYADSQYFSISWL